MKILAVGAGGNSTSSGGGNTGSVVPINNQTLTVGTYQIKVGTYSRKTSTMTKPNSTNLITANGGSDAIDITNQVIRTFFWLLIHLPHLLV